MFPRGVDDTHLKTLIERAEVSHTRVVLCDRRWASVGKNPLVDFSKNVVGLISSGCGGISHRTPEERRSR